MARKGAELKTKTILVLALVSMIAGCNVSPFSPSNRPRIRNNGDIGDMNNNQNGVMAEILSLKNRLDVIAQDVENLQNGLINTNNRNFGVQIFHGEGGLAAGVVIIVALSLLAVNYRMKSEKYKKTAEIFGEQVKKMHNADVEEEVFRAALAGRVEADVYKILKD
jgi:hypothetical protein